MAKIIFITPTLKENIIQESNGTLLLASILKNHGLSSKVFPFFLFGDPNNFDSFIQNAIDTVCKEQPSIVSFYCRCDCYHIMIELAKAIKESCGAYTVFGGPQADITAKNTLEQIPFVDYICCGEGENTIVPFFRSLLANSPDHSVAGLSYRCGDKVICNPRPELIQDLDTLPEIDYTLSCISPSKFLSDYFPLDVGRGCPFSCTYCSTNTFWGRKYRLKTPQRLVNEIKALHEQFGITSFAFEHDMFTLNRKQVIETCRLLSALDFPLTWKCSARLDCIDNELIDIMVAAGMKQIYIGIETGSPRMQKIINKNIKLEDVIDKVTYISSKNISVYTSFIYGFPEETAEDVSHTIALIRELAKIKNCTYVAHLCTFLPGTEMSTTYAQNLTPAKTFSNITGTVAVAQCADLIEQHPALFPHFKEYYTPLRESLAFFEVFIHTWAVMQPVFQYISEKYAPDHLYDMYMHFANTNREILEQGKHSLLSENIRQVIAGKNILQGFEQDHLYDILVDYHKMLITRLNTTYDNSPQNTVMCFSPADLSGLSTLENIKKGLTIVTYIRDKDGKLKTVIKRRG